MLAYTQYCKLFLLLCLVSVTSATAQEAVTEIRFNDGADGAVISLGSELSGTSAVNNGVLTVTVPGVEFRVKCAPTADVSPGECVVYAAGGDVVLDTDGDGVNNTDDSCPNTPASEIQFVDSAGCSPTERDTDGDGINDADDFCDNTPANEIAQIDANGCGPSEQTSTAGYCDNTPATYSCSPEANFDDFLADSSKDILLLARKGRSIPFTVPAGTTATGEFYYSNNEPTLGQEYEWRAWFSTTPGGAALTSGAYCSIAERDPNGIGRDWSQVSANAFNCYLGQTERLLYLNFGIFDASGALTYPRGYLFKVDKNVSSQ